MPASADETTFRLRLDACRLGGLMSKPDNHQLVLTVWRSRSGEFSVRAVLADGTRLDFASPFELARFVAALARSWPAPDAAPGSGDQTRGLR